MAILARRARAALAAAAIGLAACSGRVPGEAVLPPPPVSQAHEAAEAPLASPPPVPNPPVAEAPPSTAPPTTKPPVTAPPPPVVTPGPEGLLPGYHGPAVRELQERLAALKYDPGPRNGRYGRTTVLAVMAFQKVTGMARTGNATLDVLAALANASDPSPMLPDGGPTRVEVDLARQVLLYWRDGALVRILPVSTGHGKRYCAEGGCGIAVTPSGSFRIERRIRGVRKSRLGVLHNPLYFVGGYAIHGSPSVPARPASHGCVRIPIHTSEWFYDNVPNQTPVYLIGGKTKAVPLPPLPPPVPAAPAEPAPVETPPPPSAADPSQTAPAPAQPVPAEPAPAPAQPPPAPQPAPPEPAPQPAPAEPAPAEPAPQPAPAEPAPAEPAPQPPPSEPDPA